MKKMQSRQCAVAQKCAQMDSAIVTLIDDIRDFTGRNEATPDREPKAGRLDDLRSPGPPGDATQQPGTGLLHPTFRQLSDLMCGQFVSQLRRHRDLVIAQR